MKRPAVSFHLKKLACFGVILKTQYSSLSYNTSSSFWFFDGSDWIELGGGADAYIQQKPQSRKIEVEKIGTRKYKYLNPELYNMPKSMGVFSK